MEDYAGRGAPGAQPGLSPGAGEKAQGADAAAAVAEGGVVRRRGLGRTSSSTEVPILINTWATRCSARHTESAGWTDGREAQAAGGEDSRSRQGKEIVEDRRRGRVE